MRFEERATRLLTSVLLFSLVFSQGCFLFVLETHGDMEARVNALGLPPEFLFLARDEGGLRFGVSRGGDPDVEHLYAAPWKNGELCTQLQELAASVGTLNLDALRRHQESERLAREHGIHAADEHWCQYLVTISSGWRGRIVGVGSYRLSITAQNSKLALKYTKQGACDQLRQSGFRVGNLWPSQAQCFLPPGHGLVTIRVTGKEIVW